MSRPLRITYPGAIYHIINRGSRKDKIFRRIGDRIEFLERLQASLVKYNGILFGYCLIDNHFHLLTKHSRLKLSETAVFSGTLPNSCGSLIIKFRNDIKQSKKLKKLVDGVEEQLRNEAS